MPTVKTLVLAVLTSLAISSAQLDARHPDALNEGPLNDHDLHARGEPGLRDLYVRDTDFGGRSLNRQTQRRDADPEWEADTLYTRDPIFGSRIIKAVIKGAERGNKVNNNVQQFQNNQNRRRHAEADELDVRDPVFGSRIIKTVVKNAVEGAQNSQNQRRDAEAEAEAEEMEILEREAEWEEGLYSRDAYSEADWVPLYW